MKVVICGAGNAGKFLVDQIIEKRKDIKIDGIIDNKIVGNYRNIRIQKLNEYFDKKTESLDAVFIAARAQKTVTLFLDYIKLKTNCEIYMLHDIAGKCKLSPFFQDGTIDNYRLRKIRFSNEKPTIPYFEVPITDNCNLNCKGCLFACNGINEYKNFSFEQIKKDALKMKTLFFDVPWIRILGGEPLLHNDIEKILSMYRSIFEDSEIDLCTNGLLIPKMNESFFECLRQNRITIHVSGYKPTYNILDRIDKCLSKNNVDYTILKREEFAKYYTLSPQNNPKKNFDMCFASRCRELYNGKLMRCSGIIAFEKLNRKYNVHYQIIEDDDWFDIHKDNVDAWEIKRKLDQPSNACKYCDIDNTEMFEWDYAYNGNGEIKDYII